MYNYYALLKNKSKFKKEPSKCCWHFDSHRSECNLCGWYTAVYHKFAEQQKFGTRTFFCDTGIWIQGLTLTRHVLYCLSHTSSPCFSYFSNRVLHLCLGHFAQRSFCLCLLHSWQACITMPSFQWLRWGLNNCLASQVARITGMTHHTPLDSKANLSFFNTWDQGRGYPACASVRACEIHLCPKSSAGHTHLCPCPYPWICSEIHHVLPFHVKHAFLRGVELKEMCHLWTLKCPNGSHDIFLYGLVLMPAQVLSVHSKVCSLLKVYTLVFFVCYPVSTVSASLKPPRLAVLVLTILKSHHPSIYYTLGVCAITSYEIQTALVGRGAV
jgi:hypothetical protein